MRQRIGERERPFQRRLGLGEAPEPEERPPQSSQCAGFAGDISESRFRAEKLMGKILGLCELATVERGVGEQRERASEPGQIANRGRVLDAALGRAK